MSADLVTVPRPANGSPPASPLGRIWREVCRPFRSQWRRNPAVQRNASRPANKAVAECLAVALPPARPTIPAMITNQEADFFARCAQASGVLRGQIVDLGCWMGSTAIALANGAQRAGQRDRITAYDIFIWEDWMNASHAKLVHGIYQQGESFLPEARRVVHDQGHGLVDLVAADLTRYEWTGEPIKLLLVDAMKSMSLMEQIAKTFFPRVQRGGFVLHQDFKHRYTSWIHVLHYRLRRHFKLVESITPGGTVGFQVVEPMAAVQIAAAIRFDSVTEVEADAAFEHSLSLLDPNDRSEVAGAHVAHFCRLKDAKKVRQLADRYGSQGMDVLSNFPLAGQLLQQSAAKAA